MANVYGKGVKPFYNSVIATFIELIKTGKELTLNNNGTDKKDFIYIDDVVSAFLLTQHLNSGIYNLGTQHLVSIKELVELIEDETGRKAVKNVPKQSEIKLYVRGSISKLKKAGWLPKYDIKKGIACTV